MPRLSPRAYGTVSNAAQCRGRISQFWKNDIRQDRLGLFFKRQHRCGVEIIVGVQNRQQETRVQQRRHAGKLHPERRSISRARISSAVTEALPCLLRPMPMKLYRRFGFGA